ncbi:carboxypeptidase-like regulatory domain-containing protein [Granulicella arctica]|uniref:carboxypeptidase-like regulatory domain-containing protein n=1 Tax=Granulicella arctica TaxID=940613 RepID=UPI0021E0A439|nr:carboxypeptidase-like regulatory domain-containing protein [Granulicella arctica]
MVFSKVLGLSLVVCAGLSVAVPVAYGQEDNVRRGRKYKAPPVTSHIEVTVVKSTNHKPIPNAAVVFHTIVDGKDDGNLEVKTDPDGKAMIDVIPTGSDVRVQVIASGFATFGQDYKVDTATKEIEVAMIRPRAQVSAYTDSNGQPSQRKPGVQEPNRPPPPGVPPAGSTPPATPPVPTPTAPQTDPASVPGSTSPPSL